MNREKEDFFYRIESLGQFEIIGNIVSRPWIQGLVLEEEFISGVLILYVKGIKWKRYTYKPNVTLLRYFKVRMLRSYYKMSLEKMREKVRIGT